MWADVRPPHFGPIAPWYHGALPVGQRKDNHAETSQDSTRYCQDKMIGSFRCCQSMNRILLRQRKQSFASFLGYQLAACRYEIQHFRVEDWEVRHRFNFNACEGTSLDSTY